MELAYIYINALHFRDAVSFYEQLLQQKGKEVTVQRWVELSCGHTLAALHAEYDAQCVQKEQDVDGHYNDAYVKDCIQTVNQGNDITVQNYVCKDLQPEHTRLKNLQVGPLPPLYYVSISMPYWYFNITDLEGNVLEITGSYAPGKELVQSIPSGYILRMECDEYGAKEKILLWQRRAVIW